MPDGRKLVTLRDAATYITKLPKAEHAAPEWQAAMEALLLVADLGGPTMFARIGVMRQSIATSSACSIRPERHALGPPQAGARSVTLRRDPRDL